MFRSLRSSGRPISISQESLMRSVRSAETPTNPKRSYKINLPENAMMRSLRSGDEETGILDASMLRSLRSYKTGVADQAVMRSLRSSNNPNIVDAAMLRSLRSRGKKNSQFSEYFGFRPFDSKKYPLKFKKLLRVTRRTGETALWHILLNSTGIEYATETKTQPKA